MTKREKIIKNYFDSWITKSKSILHETFDPDVVYSECYGPEYSGIRDIERWFEDWNKKGTVLAWDIKQFVHQNDITVAEWYFKYEYEGKIDEFNGVSLVVFNAQDKIANLKEFESKIPHYFPYKD